MFFQNEVLRGVLLEAYRAYARCVVFLPSPRVFINSIPKAGTHLLTAILSECPKVMLAGRHIERWRVNRLARGRGDNRMEAFELDCAAFSRVIGTVHCGQIITAHLPWDERIPKILTEHGFANLFMIRDPRDIVVSQLHYIKGLRRHALHPWLMGAFSGDDERLMALICGGDSAGAPLPPISDRLAAYDGWCTAKQSHLTRFEELVAKPTDDDAMQLQAYARVVDHAGRGMDLEGVRALRDRVRTKSSFTFRKGTSGDWRRHFADHHKAAFKNLAGDRLIAMGYERDLEW